MNKDLIDDCFGRFREIPLALTRFGHEVTGLCLSYQHRPEAWTSDGPVRWRSLNAGRFKLFGLASFIFEARKLTKDVDIIWACSDSFYGVIAHLLSIVYRKPFVFDLYDNFEYYIAAKLPVVRQLYRMAVRKCSAVTCVSLPLADLITTYGKRHGVFVLENAVTKDLFKPLDKRSCRRELGLPDKCWLVGSAGAIHKNRGIDGLFEAVSNLKGAYPELHLAIAGPRNVKIPRKPHIHDLGLLPLEKVPIFLNALDVAVICIKDDDFGRYCFPQKTREIMACGVPLVAADVGSLREIFANFPEWLYKPGDADSLERTIENRLRDRRTDYVKPPTWSDMAKVLDTIIMSVLNKK